MEDITLSWTRLTCPALARRHAGPYAKDVSDLQRGFAHAPPGRHVRLASTLELKRAGAIADRLCGDMGVTRRRAQLGMPEQTLGSPARPCLPPTDASQSCAAGCAALRAF